MFFLRNFPLVAVDRGKILERKTILELFFKNSIVNMKECFAHFYLSASESKKTPVTRCLFRICKIRFLTH